MSRYQPSIVGCSQLSLFITSVSSMSYPACRSLYSYLLKLNPLANNFKNTNMSKQFAEGMGSNMEDSITELSQPTSRYFCGAGMVLGMLKILQDRLFPKRS